MEMKWIMNLAKLPFVFYISKPRALKEDTINLCNIKSQCKQDVQKEPLLDFNDELRPRDPAH